METDKNCAICNKSFGLLSRGKECKVCSRLACKDHMLKLQDGSLLCIACDVRMIKDERRKMLHQEIDLKNKEAEEILKEFEKIDREKKEKVIRIEEIERVLIENEKKNKEETEALEDALRGFSRELEISAIRYQQANSEMERYNAKAKEARQEVLTLEGKVQAARKQVFAGKNKKQELGLQLEYINTKLLGGLNKDKLSSILCEKCKGLLNNAIQPIRKLSDDTN